VVVLWVFGGVKVIVEVKWSSPSKGVLVVIGDLVGLVIDYVVGGVIVISVLIE